jgi:hypothetical protein
LMTGSATTRGGAVRPFDATPVPRQPPWRP